MYYSNLVMTDLLLKGLFVFDLISSLLSGKKYRAAVMELLDGSLLFLPNFDRRRVLFFERLYVCIFF